MDATDRVGALLSLLQREGRVSVAAAADSFGAAEMTIRRDLDQLAAKGVLRRVRGGAISLLMRGDELPFSLREAEGPDAKRRIGAEVARVIADGEAVLIDSGTTCVEVARALAHRRITAMALSLHSANALVASTSVKLMMAGGEVRPGEMALVGALAEASVAALRFDTAVLGCCGLTPQAGLTAHDLGDASVKRLMLASSARTVLATDSAKFSRTAMAVVCAMTELDIVVTDTSAPADAVAAMRDAGLEVRCV